ncbi:hypothetical protein [Plesiomonas shigelloides]|uniref:hypothetical protein n=1 Tax=Plesiomonas shigelloides TaxID=703 RepID=UPI003EBDE803
MNKLEANVIEYLKKFSVLAEKIDESNEKTPDFLVIQEEIVLIELKEKMDSEEVHASKEEKLSRGEMFQYTSSMAYKNRLAGVIGAGIEQLKAQKEKTMSEYCLLFIVASGVSPNNQLEQILSTLYGRRSVIDFDSTNKNSKSCYYAYHSEFYKHKDIIDAVFVATTENVFLLVNDQSINYKRFLKSGFFSKFIGKINIIDPNKLEEYGQIFIADCTFGRGNQEKVKEYVFEKYGIERGILIDFPHYTVQSRINLDEI